MKLKLIFIPTSNAALIYVYSDIFSLQAYQFSYDLFRICVVSFESVASIRVDSRRSFLYARQRDATHRHALRSIRCRPAHRQTSSPRILFTALVDQFAAGAEVVRECGKLVIVRGELG